MTVDGHADVPARGQRTDYCLCKPSKLLALRRVKRGAIARIVEYRKHAIRIGKNRKKENKQERQQPSRHRPLPKRLADRTAGPTRAARTTVVRPMAGELVL